MKVVVCNTPLRGEDAKTVYPPLGAMAVVQCLEGAGYDARFYDINYYRPSREDIKHYLLEHQPDVVGISATTSSTYKDTKEMAHLVKELLPHCAVVVGGALAFSAEILLKLGRADFTVLGEGELTAVNLVNHLAAHGFDRTDPALRAIKGISYLDDRGEVVFTGYEKQIPANEIPYPDYRIVERFSVLDQYLPEPFVYEQFKYDERSYEPRRRGKRLATVVASRGCIARCTFCHRWQQGIRVFSVENVINHTKHLMERYDIGFVSFGDEDFGATKKWIAEFAERMAEFDILYRIGAARVDNVTGDLLKKLRDSGCVAIHYGWESGSNRILKVMEKMTTVEQNIQSAMWTHEAGMQTLPALVVGMPGESPETIAETTKFVQQVTEFYPRPPQVSANILVPLPGTPVYEYARKRGVLGTTLQDEEAYLIRINNKGGESALNANLTDYPTFIVQGWVNCIAWATQYHHCKKNNIRMLPTWKLPLRFFQWLVLQHHPEKFQDGIFSHPLFYHLRYVLAPFYVALRTRREIGWKLFFERCWELVSWPFRKKFYSERLPLRLYLKEEFEKIRALGATHVKFLRLGR